MIANATSGTGTPARATAAMAMVTMAAIAVAALRGTWSVANYLKARREHHDAVADKAREAADKQKVANAGAGARKGVQSGPEFGRGAAGKSGGGRSGGSGSGSGGGSGRGSFGQQQKPTPKAGGRGSTANGSTGATGGRGTGPKGPKNATPGGSGGSGPGMSGRGLKGSGGSGSASGSGSGTGKGSQAGAKKPQGTLGQLATGRQQRKNDEVKATRQAAADHRKADLEDRAAARKEAAAAAADRRKRQAEKRKAKREREKAGAADPKSPKKPGSGKGDSTKDDGSKAKDPKTGTGKAEEKVDLTKKPKPKAGDGAAGGAKGDATEKVDLTKKPKPKADDSKGTAKPKRPKKPRAPRSWRRKKGTATGPKPTGRRRRKGASTGGPGSMPGGDGEWLRPPPGWDMSYSVEIEVIRPPRTVPQRTGIAASTTTEPKGLPPGRSGEAKPTRSEPREGPIVMGTAVSVGDVGDTQFVDADLTVYDLIDSDEEMGEQILQGVEHMNLVANKCEGLKAGLERLYALCINSKVPGVLTRWCLRLMERAGSVQDKAEALRDSLPRASEAIMTARDTAIEADKLRADRVKEAGHVAPAERHYHDRSGA
ncbi:hypothetical protein [Streptomyces sp. NPDC002287]